MNGFTGPVNLTLGGSPEGCGRVAHFTDRERPCHCHADGRYDRDDACRYVGSHAISASSGDRRPGGSDAVGHIAGRPPAAASWNTVGGSTSTLTWVRPETRGVALDYPLEQRRRGGARAAPLALIDEGGGETAASATWRQTAWEDPDQPHQPGNAAGRRRGTLEHEQHEHDHRDRRRAGRCIRCTRLPDVDGDNRYVPRTGIYRVAAHRTARATTLRVTDSCRVYFSGPLSPGRQRRQLRQVQFPPATGFDAHPALPRQWHQSSTLRAPVTRSRSCRSQRVAEYERAAARRAQLHAGDQRWPRAGATSHRTSRRRRPPARSACSAKLRGAVQRRSVSRRRT